MPRSGGLRTKPPIAQVQKGLSVNQLAVFVSELPRNTRSRSSSGDQASAHPFDRFGYRSFSETMTGRGICYKALIDFSAAGCSTQYNARNAASGNKKAKTVSFSIHRWM
jgi:hypothetical protein